MTPDANPVADYAKSSTTVAPNRKIVYKAASKTTLNITQAK